MSKTYQSAVFLSKYQSHENISNTYILLLLYFISHRVNNCADGQSNLHGGSGMLNLDRNVGASAAKMDEVNE